MKKILIIEDDINISALEQDYLEANSFEVKTAADGINGAYARLKNIQLGYTFPTQIINKLHMQKLRVYVSAENVLTITSLPSGFDPETTYSSYSDGNSGKTYPLQTTISFGLHATF